MVPAGGSKQRVAAGAPTDAQAPRGGSAAVDEETATLILPRRSVRRHLQLILQYHELLVGLVRKELKVRYKNSTLGFLWSLLNPLLYLVVYYYVFEVVLKAGVPNFPIFLLSGLLAWNLFSSALLTGTGAIVDNGSLVKKVYFPREVLPLANVGASLVHFFLQLIVLAGALVVTHWGVDPAYVWLVVPALLVLLLLASGLGIFLAACNVYARDTRHLVEVLMLAWFWLTPIAYVYSLLASRLGSKSWLMLLNPVTSVTLAMQRGIYGKTTGNPGPDGVPQPLIPDENQLWYLRNLVFVGVGALILLIVAIKIFDRAEGNFAEEI